MADIQKVVKLKEIPKLIKKEEKEISPSVNVVKPVNIKEEQEKEENIDIKNVGLLLDTDFAINLAKNIINQQKHNKLDRNKDKIYLDFNTLGIERSQDNTAKLMHHLKRFKSFGGIEDKAIGSDFRIIINKPNIRALRRYIRDFDSAGEDEQKVDYIYRKSGNSSFFFLGYAPLILAGRRADIIQFFYTSNKIWKTYEEIKDEIINCNSGAIKKDIKAINKRFSEHTGNKFREIIESKPFKNGKRESYEYRWNL